MVDLPPVPDLSLDESGDAKASSAGSPTPAPAPAPAPAKPAVTAPTDPVTLPTGIEEAEDGAPKPVPAPGTPPPPGEGSGPPEEAGAVQDSVEEVLQQAADQSLRLSHLEDILSALNQTLSDIQDEMHAGFAELRAVLDSNAEPTTRPTEATFKSSLTERLDFVEEQTIKANKHQSTLMMIAIAQAVLLVAVLLAVFLAGGSSEPEAITSSGPPPSYLTTESQPSKAEKPEPPTLEPTRIKSKRKRGRKR